MDGMPIFNSIEDVKSYLSSTDAQHSAAVIMGEKGPIPIPFTVLVEKLGIDKAAEFIFETHDKGKEHGISKEEYFAMKEKALKDPESLTEEEKQIFVVAHNIFEGKDHHFDVMNDVLAIVTKTFMDLDYIGHYGSLLAVFLTMAEGLLITNSEKLSGYHENPAIYKEVLESAKAQISFPEDMDDELLLLGLLEIIGDRFIVKDSPVSRRKSDYKKFAERLELNSDIINDTFLGNEENFEKENLSETSEEKSKVIDVRSRMKGLS